MNFSINTPALLFPAVTLLMLAYTNRFNTLAAIIRDLYGRYKTDKDKNLLAQISNLRYRVYLIRNMQICGVLSLLLCMVSMFALFEDLVLVGQWLFASALILMIVSMVILLRELQVSVNALDLLLMDMAEEKKRGK
jgi:hypothetical protein